MRFFSPSTVEHPWREALLVFFLACLLMWNGYWAIVQLLPPLLRLMGPFGWSPPVSA